MGRDERIAAAQAATVIGQSFIFDTDVEIEELTPIVVADNNTATDGKVAAIALAVHNTQDTLNAVIAALKANGYLKDA